MRRRSPAPAAGRRGLAVLLGTCLATLGLLTLGMSVAQAHDRLESSSPEAGARLDTSPSEIELRFSGNIQELGTEVVVSSADGTVVSEGPVEIDGTTAVQPLADDLPAGDYVVDWRATSADGHPLSDSFTFTVTGGTTEESAADTSPGAAASSSEVAEPATDVDETATARAADSPSGLWIAVSAAVVLAVAALVAARQLRRRS